MRTPVFRPPIGVLLLHPFQLPAVVSLFVLSVTFTIWPELLDHAAVSFEVRGPVHHIWHYSLLGGAIVTLLGMFYVSRRYVQIELAGVCVLTGAVLLNLVAAISDLGAGSVTGIGLALRIAFVLGMVIRAYILLVQPAVVLPVAVAPSRDEQVDG